MMVTIHPRRRYKQRLGPAKSRLRLAWDSNPEPFDHNSKTLPIELASRFFQVLFPSPDSYILTDPRPEIKTFQREKMLSDVTRSTIVHVKIYCFDRFGFVLAIFRRYFII